MIAYSKEAEDSHTWGEPVKYAGSIADGPPPGVNHRGALVYECLNCHRCRVVEVPTELKDKFYDGNNPPPVTRDVSDSQFWRGEPCGG